MITSFNKSTRAERIGFVKQTIRKMDDIEEITPELAEKLLKNNFEGQRNLNARVVERYARDIANGRWDEDACMPIIISDTGKMLDGQHRCAAVVKCGVPLLSYVRYGVSEESFTYIDAGRVRAAGDFISGKNRNVIAAAARFLLLVRDGYALKSPQTTHTRAQIVEFAEECEEELQVAARKANKIRQDFNWSQSGVCAGLFCIEHTPRGKKDVDSFLGWATGLPDDKFLQAWQVEWLKHSERYRIRSVYWGYKAISVAWNHYLTGKPTSMSRFMQISDQILGFECDMLPGSKDVKGTSTDK